MSSFCRTIVLEDGYILLRYMLPYSMYIYSLSVYHLIFLYFPFLFFSFSSLRLLYPLLTPPRFVIIITISLSRLTPHELEYHPAKGEKCPFCFLSLFSKFFICMGWVGKGCIPVSGFFSFIFIKTVVRRGEKRFR